jgi:putative oxidoreductase
VQRLFSTFANGWPGLGLLTQRLVLGAVLVCNAVASVRATPDGSEIFSQIIALTSGILLVAGLWTPISGVLLALVESWILFSRSGKPWVPVLLAALGVTLAMIGPGAWSVDALLFGRKRIQPPDDFGPASP